MFANQELTLGSHACSLLLRPEPRFDLALLILAHGSFMSVALFRASRHFVVVLVFRCALL